jgi:hypothetical protein
MNKFSSTKNYFYALLLAFTVLALGACSSSDEAAEEDTSGQSSDGHDCSMYPAESAREECQALKDAAN